jgi:hypothetical protein
MSTGSRAIIIIVVTLAVVAFYRWGFPRLLTRVLYPKEEDTDFDP